MKKHLLIALLLLPLPALAANNAIVVQKGRAFSPAEITINQGDSLTFTNNDEFIHQIYVKSDSFSFDTDERAPGENITETFTAAGTFEVHCHIHPLMKLTVHVR